MWVFQDETGEWDSLLKGEGKIPVGEPVEQTLSVILESYHNHTGTCGAALYLTGTAAESGTLQYTLVRTASYGDGTGPTKHVTTYGEGTHIEAGVNFDHSFICDSTVSDGDSDCRWDYTCIFVPDNPNSPTIDLHT